MFFVIFFVIGIALPVATTFIIYGIRLVNQGNFLLGSLSFFVVLFPIAAIVGKIFENYSKPSSNEPCQ